MDLEPWKTPRSIPCLVTLPARLSHYEGQGGGEMRGKNPHRSWTERWKGKEERTGEGRAKIGGMKEMANSEWR